MSITPLPVFEADADPANRSAMTDEEIYASLEAPKTIVIRFSAMKYVAEYPYRGNAKPGCGTKLVARTHRGTEVVEMLTTTCDNAGCGKSISRKELREYIENSGGKDFPFYTNGRILRVATIDDLNRRSSLLSEKPRYVKFVKEKIAEYELDMTLVDVELIIGMEVVTIYYMAEHRVDFRDLIQDLASEFSARIDMKQVGARDEARLVADYERCGQHCCCKNFLKVLKPVSMRAAKVQKATLDPLKISGRCGRLMCCLRYEDQTYKELKSNLPHRKTRVGTAEGPGIVLDSKILVQLVLVKLEHDGREIAVPVEELMDPDKCPPPGSVSDDADDPLRGLSTDEAKERGGDRGRGRRDGKRKRGRGRKRSKAQQQDAYRERAKAEDRAGSDDQSPGDRSLTDTGTRSDQSGGDGGGRKRRRRRGRGRSRGKSGGTQPENKANTTGSSPNQPGSDAGGDGQKKRKRRRRRRGRGGGGGGGNDGGGGSGGS